MARPLCLAAIVLGASAVIGMTLTSRLVVADRA
jgi:hypothetical protein